MAEAVTIRIKNQRGRLIPSRPVDIDSVRLLKPGGEYKAVISNAKVNTEATEEEQRSAAQNRLLWMWLTDMQNTQNNEHAGTTKEDWHIRMKREFLLTIYERDCDENEWQKPYSITIKALRKAYRLGARDEVDILLNHIASKATTTEATVKQFAEYLNCIERYCYEKGIWLRTNARLYQMAMFGNC